ncbi:MAG TPA: hypothetical protein VF194_12560 [Ferrovibrio sp.]|uniref:hypothetical protein n=1 Tax=Ferrovibrio sp. TaxID=1917215 RepID=UPI002ED4DB67
MGSKWPGATQPMAASSHQSGSGSKHKKGADKAEKNEATNASEQSSSPGDTSVVLTSAVPPSVGEDRDMSLSGLREDELRDLLGKPTVVEDRPPAKIWRYKQASCHLNVSFYPDVETRVFRILSYEVKSNDDTDQGKRQCWSELRSHARSK